ncbi:MAG TPA: hypothetical protein VN784_09270 [Candidatus Limnocylindrales bacterium]|nr:hypothetical protein [Candidatus Limnocylindrales bacterium]
MKTPREILFKRHQAAEPKLDAIRKTVVREGQRAAVPKSRAADTATLPAARWLEFFLSLRWHLAGMGAAWLVIVLLNLNVGQATNLASAIPRAKIPPAQIILATLRENRRELLEMIQPSESRDVRPTKLFPRSERSYETLTA